MPKNVLKLVLDGDAEPLRRKLRSNERYLRRWGERMGRTMRRLGLAAGAAFATTLRRSIGAFAAFEAELAAAGARTGLGLRRFRREYEAEIRRISLATGIEAARVTQAVDKAVSGGLSGAAAASVADAAARAEAAGLGMADALVSAATTIATAYRDELGDAAHAVDLLVATLQRGDGAAAEFAPALKRNAALASQLGVRLTDTAAALATISNVSPSVAEAGTQLQSFLKTFASDAGGIRDKLQRVADATGLEVTLPAVQARLRAGDLSGVVRDLSEALLPRDLAALAARAREATGQARDDLLARLQQATREQLDEGTAAGTVFGRVESLQAFLALAGDYEGFLDRSTSAAEALGRATGKAFDDTRTTAANRWLRFMRLLDEALRQIGQVVAPALNPLLDLRLDSGALREFAGYVRAVADALVSLTLKVLRNYETIVVAVGAYLSWTVVLPWLNRLFLGTALRVAKVVKWIRALTLAMVIAKAKAIALQLAMVAGGVAIFALGAAVGAVAFAIYRSWDEIKTATGALVDNVVLRFEEWKLKWRLVWAGIKLIATTGLRRLLNAISSGLNGIVAFINTWIGRINILLAAQGKEQIGFISGFGKFGSFLDDDVARQRDAVRGLIDEWGEVRAEIAKSNGVFISGLKAAGSAVGKEFLAVVGAARDQAAGFFGFGGKPAFDADSFAAGFGKGRDAGATAQTFARDAFLGAPTFDFDAWRRVLGAGGGGSGGSGEGDGGTAGPAVEIAGRFTDSLREAFLDQDYGGFAQRLAAKFRAALVDGFFDRIAENLPGLFAKGGGGFGDRANGFLKGIFAFHDGGVVPGRPGEEVFALLEAGERVTPANAAGGAVTQIFRATYIGDVDDAVRRANARQMRANALLALEAQREARL